MLGLSASPASAHAVLVASDPVDGARLQSAPTVVTLTFDEPIRLVPAAAQVIAGDGATVNVEPARIRSDGVTIEIPLPGHLPKGSYTATWRVVSADTHVIAGSITFGVGQDAHAPPAMPAPQARSVNVTANVVRGILYTGLVLCLGVFIASRMLWPWTLSLRRTRVLVRAGWTAIVLAIISGFTLAVVSDAMSSRTGVLLIVRALLIAALAIEAERAFRASPEGVKPANKTLPPVVFSAAAVGLAASIAVDGHAGVGPDAWLAVIATTAHLLAMSIWLGGLLCLCLIVLPSRHTDNLRAGGGDDRTLDGGLYAEIHVDTTRRGPTSIKARVFGPGGKIASPQSVTATLSSADANTAALPVEFVPDRTGTWRSTYATLPRPGLWRLQLTVTFAAADAVVTTVALRAW